MTAFFPVPFRILTMEFPVKIVLGNRKDEIAGPMVDGTMAVGLRTSGRSNGVDGALRSFLARHYGVPQAAIQIRIGEAPAMRRVRIAVQPAPVSKPPHFADIQIPESAVAWD